MFANGTAPYQPALESEERDPLCCPRCGRADRVEKASAIVKQQSGQIFFDRTGLPGFFRSTLVVELAEPEPPRSRSWETAAAGVLMSLAAAGALIIARVALAAFDVAMPPWVEYGFYSLLALFGLALPAWIVLATQQFRAEARRLQPAWQLARERWERLFYCFRDDVVFYFGQGDWEAASRAHLFLYAP